MLVTGGTGYIGSHTVVLLVEAGARITIIDNLANSNTGVLARIAAITGKPDAVAFTEVDLRDKEALLAVFRAGAFDSVIHFAGYKVCARAEASCRRGRARARPRLLGAAQAVGESRAKPMLYYSNNLRGTITYVGPLAPHSRRRAPRLRRPLARTCRLLEVMAETGVKSFVFSSSCTVYGDSPSPLTEDSPTGGGITNAYARSKFQIEEMLGDLYAADATWSICILRYFNPVGAHPSGLIGEDPRGTPNCLMPYVLQVLVGRLDKLTVYGEDYPTRDGERRAAHWRLVAPASQCPASLRHRAQARPFATTSTSWTWHAATWTR